MGVIAAYRRVLSNGPLARLMFGEFVSSIGDWLYLVALLVVIWQETQDPVLLGLVGSLRIVPYIVLSVPAGIVADRFDRRLVLLATDVARGVIMLLIAAAVILELSVWVIVVLAVLATCFSAFFSPTIGAYLPSLVRDESELGPANSAWSSLDNLAFFIGPAFAAVLLALNNLALAFILNAVTFAVVALVLFRLPSKPAAATAPAETAAVEPVKVGLRETLRPILRPLVGITVLDVADSFVFGGLGVITVILAVDILAVGEEGTGLLNSAIGVGGVIGAVIAGGLVLRRRLGPPLLAGAIGLAAGLALLGIFRDFSLALGAMVVASAGTLLLEIVNTTLLQRIVPDAVRGRTLGVIHTVSVSAYALGALVLPIAAAGEPTAVLVGSGIFVAVSGVVAVVLLGKYAIQEPVIDPAIRRLADVAMFAGLPPARLETAMRAARVGRVKAGEVVIRQGEPADNFYTIAAGAVEVSQVAEGGESRVLRRMGATEFFGEIGLLSGVPRTATVTVVEDGTLISLPGAAFLELVSGGPGLTYQLLNLHRGVTAES